LDVNAGVPSSPVPLHGVKSRLIRSGDSDGSGVGIVGDSREVNKVGWRLTGRGSKRHGHSVSLVIMLPFDLEGDSGDGLVGLLNWRVVVISARLLVSGSSVWSGSTISLNRSDHNIVSNDEGDEEG